MPRLSTPVVLATLAVAVFACGIDDDGPDAVNLSGVISDYFTDAPIGSASLSIAELPGLTETATANGTYNIEDIPANSTITVLASATNYQETRNVPVSFATSTVIQDLFAVSAADVARQFVSIGITAVVGAHTVFAELRDAGGNPREGIPLADISLVDQSQAAVGNGPYVFGAAGDMVTNANLAVTTAFAGRSRVGFLNVPPGTYTLRVVAGASTFTRVVVAPGNGVTLVER